MNQSLEAVKTFLDQHEIRYDQLDDHILHAGVGGKNSLFPAFLDIDDEKGSLLVLTIVPASVPQSRRVAVAELPMRINWALLLGNFEMDMEDGQVRVRTSIRLGKTGLTEEAITHVLLANLAMMDSCFGAINTVAFGDTLPKAALKRVEGSRPTTSAGRSPRHSADRLSSFFDASNN